MSMLQDVSSLAQSVALNVPTLAVGQIRIVLVEDDEDYREAASAELEELGFDVKSFASGGELFASLDVCRTAQIIVLDWFLESGTGDALLLGLREEGVRLPVVFLTGRSAPFIETLALDRGALDFVDKSRGIPILAKRLRLIAATKHSGESDLKEICKIGELLLKPRVSRAFWRGVDVDLTFTEFKIVHLLASNAGSHKTYRAIYDCVHHEGFIAGSGEDGFRTNVRSSIRRIRQKWKSLDPTFDAIENYASFGYCWRKV